MPQGLVYSLLQHDMSSLERFVKVQLVDGLVARELKPVAVPYDKMVLVCTHMSRDKRCGRAGPQVIVYFLAILWCSWSMIYYLLGPWTYSAVYLLANYRVCQKKLPARPLLRLV